MSVSVDGRATEDLADWCLRTAMAPPLGPVHLALPSNLATQPVVQGARLAESGREATGGEARSGEALDEVASALSQAKRPLLLVGLGCSPNDVPPLRRFVDMTGIPFVLTPKAKGFLPEDAPGFLGVVSGMALDNVMLETLDLADTLLGVGFDPVECDKPWYTDRIVVNLSRYRTAEGGYHPIEHMGDIGASLDALATHAVHRSWPSHLLAERRAAIRPQHMTNAQGVSPLAAVQALRETLLRETVMTCDAGSHKYFIGQFWESYEPQTLFMSNGLSAMRFGIPAAITAKLHFPQRPVVSVVGDGGMLMMQHNLVFLRQYGVPVVLVCFVDNSLSLIRLAQERRGLQAYGVDFPAPNFAGIAEKYGIRGVLAKTTRGLKRAIAQALETGLPTVVHVPIDQREYNAFC